MMYPWALSSLESTCLLSIRSNVIIFVLYFSVYTYGTTPLILITRLHKPLNSSKIVRAAYNGISCYILTLGINTPVDIPQLL